MESINITPVNMTSNDQITTLVDVNTNYHIVLTASNDNDPYSEFYPFRAFSDIGFSLGFSKPYGWWQINYNKDIHISKIEVLVCSFITVTIYNTSGSFVAQQSNTTVKVNANNEPVAVSFDFGQDTVGNKIHVYLWQNPEQSYSWKSLYRMKIYGNLLDYYAYHRFFCTKPSDIAYDYV